MAGSYWQMISPGVSYPALASDIHPGVAVIGGGITGLTTALLLAEQGVDTALIEARRVGGGATGHSTGKVTVQQGDIYGRLMHSAGRAVAGHYKAEMQRALDFVRQRHDALSLPYTEAPNIVFATSDTGRVRLRDDYQAGRAIGLHTAWLGELELPVQNLSAVRVAGQLAINPKAYCDALAAEFVRKGGHIYERTAVIEVKDGDMVHLRTARGHTVMASAVIQSVGYPLYPKVGLHLLRLRPTHTHLMAFKLNQPIPEGMYIALDDPIPTLRTHNHLGEDVLIIGGMGHRTGATARAVYGHIEAYARNRFDLGPPVAWWGTEDYITPDGMPYVGRSGDHDHIYTAVGFNKWGLAGGTAAALALARAATGGGFPDHYPFAPGRMLDLFTREAAGNALEASAHFVSDRLSLSRTAPKRAGEGRVVLVGGRRCGAYRRRDGELLIVAATCTHLGCPLSFNAAEHSWDCPCHGSRFAPDGSVIFGPAAEPLERIWL